MCQETAQVSLKSFAIAERVIKAFHETRHVPIRLDTFFVSLGRSSLCDILFMSNSNVIHSKGTVQYLDWILWLSTTFSEVQTWLGHFLNDLCFSILVFKCRLCIYSRLTMSISRWTPVFWYSLDLDKSWKKTLSCKEHFMITWTQIRSYLKDTIIKFRHSDLSCIM